jgi:MscS family membrane protein
MMKDIFAYSFYGHTIFEYSMALVCIAGAFAVGRLSLWLNRKVMQKKALATANKYDDIFLQTIDRPMMLAIVVAGIWLGAKALHLPADTTLTITKACKVLLVLCTAWFAAKLSKGFLTEYIENNKHSDKHLAHSIRRAAYALIWLLAAIMTLQMLGVNLRALLATLGIGGAAVALASQDILKNIIGGITLVIDRPFKIGDYIRTKDIEGTIRRIGLRSTSVRTLDSRSVTIPNSKMTDAAIENVSSEHARRIILKLGLVYQTTPEQMQQALAILTAMHSSVASLGADSIASFSGYGDFALEITFIYYIKKKTEADIYRVRSEVNSAILSSFAAAGLEFAYPTQTILLKNSTTMPYS